MADARVDQMVMRIPPSPDRISPGAASLNDSPTPTVLLMTRNIGAVSHRRKRSDLCMRMMWPGPATGGALYGMTGEPVKALP